MERLTSTGKQAADYLSLPPVLLNRALQLVFTSEQFVVGRVSMPFGLSLLAVARTR